MKKQMEHEMEASGPKELCSFGLFLENQTEQKMVNEMRSWVILGCMGVM